MGRITLFVQPNCPYCEKIKKLLLNSIQCVQTQLDELTNNYGIEIQSFDVKQDPARSAQCVRLSKSHTLPQVFFNDEHMGSVQTTQVFQKCGELTRRLIRLAQTPHAEFPPPPQARIVKIDDELAFSSQPTASQLSQLGSYGMQSVVNLTHPDEKGTLTTERAVVLATGLVYKHVPPPAAPRIPISHVEVDLAPHVKDEYNAHWKQQCGKHDVNNCPVLQTDDDNAISSTTGSNPRSDSSLLGKENSTQGFSDDPGGALSEVDPPEVEVPEKGVVRYTAVEATNVTQTVTSRCLSTRGNEGGTTSTDKAHDKINEEAQSDFLPSGSWCPGSCRRGVTPSTASGSPSLRASVLEGNAEHPFHLDLTRSPHSAELSERETNLHGGPTTLMRSISNDSHVHPEDSLSVCKEGGVTKEGDTDIETPRTDDLENDNSSYSSCDQGRSLNDQQVLSSGENDAMPSSPQRESLNSAVLKSSRYLPSEFASSTTTAFSDGTSCVWTLTSEDLGGRDPLDISWTLEWGHEAIESVEQSAKPVLVHCTTGLASCAITLLVAGKKLNANAAKVHTWGKALGHHFEEHPDLATLIEDVLGR